MMAAPRLMVFEPLESRVLLTAVTFDSVTPTPIPIGAVKAGQTINLSVNYATTDNQEGFEGEPLVLVPSAGGAITIAAFGQQTVALPIVQDGETLSGFVVGADGDELATVSTVASGQILINDTATTADNLTLYNPPTLTMPYVQTIPARIVNTSATTETFALSVTQGGTGNVALSQQSVTLAPGASTEVTVTPTAVSSAANDVHIIATDNGQKIAEDDMTVVSVQMEKYIYNADTPLKMVQGGFYRIPTSITSQETQKPIIVTPTTVQIMPSLTGSGQSITLLVTDQGDAAAGNVFVDGEITESLAATKVVELDGGNQTFPGHAAHLQLTAQVRGDNTIQSAGFSVAAIPINFVVTFKSEVTNGAVGFIVNTKWSSDDGFVDALGDTMLSESVQYEPGTGVFTNPAPANNSHYNVSGDQENAFDTHSRITAEIIAGAATYSTTSGKLIAEQTFMFNDTRTGATDIPMQNSGFLIKRTVYAIEGKLYCTTSKVGAAVTANGVSSAAGSGAVFITQEVGAVPTPPTPPAPPGPKLVAKSSISRIATPGASTASNAGAPVVGGSKGRGATVVRPTQLTAVTSTRPSVAVPSDPPSRSFAIDEGQERGADSSSLDSVSAFGSDESLASDSSMTGDELVQMTVMPAKPASGSAFKALHWLKAWVRSAHVQRAVERHRP